MYLFFPAVPLRNFNMSLVLFYFQDLSQHNGSLYGGRLGVKQKALLIFP